MTNRAICAKLQTQLPFQGDKVLKIKVLQVCVGLDRNMIQDYALADFDGKKRRKTLFAIYGCIPNEARTNIVVREVLSRIAPPIGYVWYKPQYGRLRLYKDWRNTG